MEGVRVQCQSWRFRRPLLTPPHDTRWHPNAALGPPVRNNVPVVRWCEGDCLDCRAKGRNAPPVRVGVDGAFSSGLLTRTSGLADGRRPDNVSEQDGVACTCSLGDGSAM